MPDGGTVISKTTYLKKYTIFIYTSLNEPSKQLISDIVTLIDQLTTTLSFTEYCFNISKQSETCH